MLLSAALYSSLLPSTHLCCSVAHLCCSLCRQALRRPRLYGSVSWPVFFFGLLRQQGSYCYDDYDRHCYRYCYEYTGSTTHRRRRMRALASRGERVRESVSTLLIRPAHRRRRMRALASRARSSMKSSILRVRTTSNGDSNSSNLRL